MSRTPSDEQQGRVNPGKVRMRPVLLLIASSAQFSCWRPQLWWIWVRVSGGCGVSKCLTSKGCQSPQSLHHRGIRILLCRNAFICIQHRNCLQHFLSVCSSSNLDPNLWPLCRRMNLTVEKKKFFIDPIVRWNKIHALCKREHRIRDWWGTNDRYYPGGVSRVSVDFLGWLWTCDSLDSMS